MSETPVSDLRDELERMETAYEFLISYAGQGVGREVGETSSEQVRDYVQRFEAALDAGYDAANRVGDVHDDIGTGTYDAFVADLGPEVERARTVLQLLAEQDRITSAQVDNLNGMAVFQSVMMKFFFLDELTTHLERSGDDDGGPAKAGDADRDA